MGSSASSYDSAPGCASRRPRSYRRAQGRLLVDLLLRHRKKMSRLNRDTERPVFSCRAVAVNGFSSISKESGGKRSRMASSSVVQPLTGVPDTNRTAESGEDSIIFGTDNLMSYPICRDLQQQKESSTAYSTVLRQRSRVRPSLDSLVNFAASITPDAQDICREASRRVNCRLANFFGFPAE